MKNSTGDTALLFINTLGSGGAQRQIVLLARELSGRGIKVVLLHYGDSDYMAYMLQNSSVDIIWLRAFGRTQKVILFVRLIAKIFAIRPRLAISFIDLPNIIMGVSKILRPSMIWVPSERNTTTSNSLKETFWRRFFYRFAQAVVPNSSSQLQWLEDNIPSAMGKSRVIKNGIAPELFAAPDLARLSTVSQSFEFLVLGRVGHQKNPDLLVRSLKLMKPELRGRISFKWYGEEEPTSPGLLNALKAEVVQFGLPISFSPAIKDTAAALAKADALVLCSIYEGTPNVVLEAMAASRLVISSDIADIPQLLGFGERGVLYESNNAESLVNAIESVIHMDRQDVCRRVERAYDYVAYEYSSTKMATRFLEAAGLETRVQQNGLA